MSNSRFGLSNYALFGTVANGTGTNAALYQDADFPMANAINGSRFVPWKVPGTAASSLDIDLGSSPNISMVALLGYRTVGNPNLPPTGLVDVLRGPAGPAVIPVGTAIIPNTDCGITFTSFTSRYWRLNFFNAARTAGPEQFTLGGIYIGINTDLGLSYSPSEISEIRSRTINRTMSGVPVVTDMGFKRKLINANFNSVTAATRTTLQGLVDADRSFVYATPLDEWHECVLSGGMMKVQHKWGSPHLFDIGVEMETLP